MKMNPFSPLTLPPAGVFYSQQTRQASGLRTKLNSGGFLLFQEAL